MTWCFYRLGQSWGAGCRASLTHTNDCCFSSLLVDLKGYDGMFSVWLCSVLSYKPLYLNLTYLYLFNLISFGKIIQIPDNKETLNWSANRRWKLCFPSAKMESFKDAAAGILSCNTWEALLDWSSVCAWTYEACTTTGALKLIPWTSAGVLQDILGPWHRAWSGCGHTPLYIPMNLGSTQENTSRMHVFFTNKMYVVYTHTVAHRNQVTYW